MGESIDDLNDRLGEEIDTLNNRLDQGYIRRAELEQSLKDVRAVVRECWDYLEGVVQDIDRVIGQ